MKIKLEINENQGLTCEKLMAGVSGMPRESLLQEPLGSLGKTCGRSLWDACEKPMAGASGMPRKSLWPGKSLWQEPLGYPGEVCGLGKAYGRPLGYLAKTCGRNPWNAQERLLKPWL